MIKWVSLDPTQAMCQAIIGPFVAKVKGNTLYLDLYGIDEFDGMVHQEDFSTAEKAMEEAPRIAFEIVDSWFRSVLLVIN